MFKEHERAILTEALPDHGLEAGDVGTVVLVHKEGPEYEVEFVALNGETFAVVTVYAHQIRQAAIREVPHARAIP